MNPFKKCWITSYQKLNTTDMQSYNLTHLKELESEAIFIIREVAAQFERPGDVILWR